ncbi:MAG: diguanylate cyclase [Deltaproteobacteria bacterium]|nr:diguanylate cyclase [Deltaproteobacteria bacterium]
MTDTGKVLLVDDSQTARSAMKTALKGTFSHFVEADDGLTAIKAFVEEKPCFIITDIEMPSINGYKLISTIRAMEDGQNVPIIMISGTKQSLKNRLTGFNAGASDFIVKPYEDEELIARVKSLLRIHRLMEELKVKNTLLEKLAVTDELTGLNNRRHFFDAVKTQVSAGLRPQCKTACLLMDIDHFKKTNDTHGHAAGDEILRKMGRLLNSCKRDGELLARFGGEEFVICLFNTDSESALLAAERFRHLIKSYDFSSPLFPERQITVSVGVSIYTQALPVSIDDLIKTADKAMYQSKADGRDRVSIYEEFAPKAGA